MLAFIVLCTMYFFPELNTVLIAYVVSCCLLLITCINCHCTALILLFTGARFLDNTGQSLMNIVNNIDDEISYHISNSYYYTDTEVYTMLQNTHTFTILSLNTQSLSATFTDITLFIDELWTHNCYVDVINFQETWITDNTYYADFNISGYTMYVQRATCSTHSGLITYITTYLQSTKLTDFTYQNSQTWEGMFIEIENLNKAVIIVNIGLPRIKS